MVSPDATPHRTGGAAGASGIRVNQHLKDGLASGTRPPGALMPSEAGGVAQFGVSRMTVNRALLELQAEGLVDDLHAYRAHRHRAADAPWHALQLAWRFQP